MISKRVVYEINLLPSPPIFPNSNYKIFRISYGDGLETPMDAVILVLKSPQLTGTPWMIWFQVKEFSN